MVNLSSVTKEEALAFHELKPSGKLATHLTKPLNNARDLSLAYTPGVGHPCLEIQKDHMLAYKYTSKGNLVAVISNGTAVLGFGNIGALASKPVMEGKSALFKRFADVDSIDLLVNTQDPDEFIKTVALVHQSFGGINLEDIKAPECFEIEMRLKSMLDIPVFHDDQHGTAVITLAGIINSSKITGKNITDLKIVINGAGAAGISCAKLMTRFGIPRNNIVMCDKTGVIYQGRSENMNKWKEEVATDTKDRTLLEASKGADVLIGLSSKGAFTVDMISALNSNPVIFAMANPEPEILPEQVKAVRTDAIMATGRSDYPNQINNVLCFPYLFRGALDVMAKEINIEMQIAAAEGLAKLALEKVPEEVQKAYPGRILEFGKEYIVPTIFDPRLPTYVSSIVSEVAERTGVARCKKHFFSTLEY